MVGIYSHPEDFFIHGTKDKLWIVVDDSIYEIKDYVIPSFMFEINRSNTMLRSLGEDNKFGIIGQPEMRMSIEIIPTEANYINRKDVDITEFYSIEESKKLSKIIQRKFDKILEETEKE